MFGLFTRPTRRPRKTRPAIGRPALRVEALEARANPDANPVISNVTAIWSAPTQVTITGTVADLTAVPAPSAVLVGGAATPTIVTTNAQGVFNVTVNVAAGGPVALAAEPVAVSLVAGDPIPVTTAPVSVTSNPVPVTVVAQNQPTLSNVQLQVGSDGDWHITGQVVGGTPIDTVINIISSIPGESVNNLNVVNPDGTFDIGLGMAPGSPGGSVGITLGDGNGDVFDQWDGSI